MGVLITKKLSLVLCSLLLVLGLAACGSSNTNSTNTEIANPFVEYGDYDSAVKALGFDFKLPDGIVATACIYSVDENQMIEAVYNADGYTVFLRKMVGTDDASGDYNTYASVITETIAGHQVQLRGDGTTYKVALYTDGTYSYAVVISGGSVTHQQIVDYISTIG